MTQLETPTQSIPPASALESPVATPTDTTLLDNVRRLEGMSLQELRDEWVRRFGPSPRLRSAELLRRLLAWRIQADVFGGLDRKLVRELVLASKRARPPRAATPAGVRLSREWKGQLHEVEVVDGGFVYLGVRYKSLSVIARKIAGTRWNGPRFFGLREGAE